MVKNIRSIFLTVFLLLGLATPAFAFTNSVPTSTTWQSYQFSVNGGNEPYNGAGYGAYVGPVILPFSSTVGLGGQFTYDPAFLYDFAAPVNIYGWDLPASISGNQRPVSTIINFEDSSNNEIASYSNLNENQTVLNVSQVAIQIVGDSFGGYYFSISPPSIFSSTSAPTNLIVNSINSQKVSISWNAVTGAGSYDVFLDGKNILNTAATSANLSGLTSGTHTITVEAVNLNGPSPASNLVSVNILSAPLQPTVTVTGTDANVSWPAVSGASSYVLYVDGQSTQNISTTSAQLSGLSLGNHTVYIEAVNANGPSQPSPSATFTAIQLSAPLPQDVTQNGTPGGDGTITWIAGQGSSNTTYSIYDNGVLIGTTQNTTVSISNYNPKHVYSVVASMPGHTNSVAVSYLSGVAQSFSVRDILNNSIHLIMSVNPYVLLLLVMFFAVKIVPFIKNIFSKSKSTPTKKSRQKSGSTRSKRPAKTSSVSAASTTKVTSSVKSETTKPLLYSEKKETILSQMVKSRTSNDVLQTRLANFYESSGLSKDYAYKAAGESVKKWRVDRKVKDDFSVDFGKTLSRYKDKEISYTTRKGSSKGRNYDI